CCGNAVLKNRTWLNLPIIMEVRVSHVVQVALEDKWLFHLTPRSRYFRSTHAIHPPLYFLGLRWCVKDASSRSYTSIQLYRAPQCVGPDLRSRIIRSLLASYRDMSTLRTSSMWFCADPSNMRY